MPRYRASGGTGNFESTSLTPQYLDRPRADRSGFRVTRIRSPWIRRACPANRPILVRLCAGEPGHALGPITLRSIALDDLDPLDQWADVSNGVLSITKGDRTSNDTKTARHRMGTITAMNVWQRPQN